MHPSVISAILGAFKPKLKQPPLDWLHENIEDIPYSPFPGRFSVENFPLQKHIIEAILSPYYQKVIISACVQSGKTLAAEVALCHLIANAPATAMWLDLTDDTAKDQGETHLRPLFENCPPVKAVFPKNEDKLRNRSILFENGMNLWILGANNKANLQRRAIRYIFGDETWMWKAGRMREAEARTTAFGRRGKCVFISQGSFKGDDTARAFEDSDRREWCFSCPDCGEVQPFVWKNLTWDESAKNEAGEWDMEAVRKSAKYNCRKCGREFDDSDEARSRLNAFAWFVPHNPNAPKGVVGFHWNALATMPWGNLAVEYLLCKKRARRGNLAPLQEFYQKRLALAWGNNAEEDELTVAPGESGGYALGEEWSGEAVFDRERNAWCTVAEFAETGAMQKPAARLRFLTVDVQEAYFYYVVRAWNQTGDSRLIARGMTMEVAEIESVRERFEVNKELTFIDAGYKTQRVYSLCGRRGYTALMGDRRDSFLHEGNVNRPFSRKRLIDNGRGQKGAAMFLFSNRAVKDTLAAIRAGKTEMKWELPKDIDVKYLRQINAEFFDEEKQAWVCPQGKDNHFFDCETMQIAAAMISKIIA